jgi:hypothetical protein
MTEHPLADVQILRQADGSTTEALVRRMVHQSSKVRVELTLSDARDIWAQITRESAQKLELEERQILPVHLPDQRVFAP